MIFAFRGFHFHVAGLLGAIMLFSSAAHAEIAWSLDARWPEKMMNPNSSSLIAFLGPGEWPSRYVNPPTLTIEQMNCFDKRAVPEEILRTSDGEMEQTARMGIHDMTVIALVKIINWCRR